MGGRFGRRQLLDAASTLCRPPGTLLFLRRVAVIASNGGFAAFRAYRVSVVTQPSVKDLRSVNLWIGKLGNKLPVRYVLGSTEHELEVPKISPI
jgi:hypothetical protein